MAKSPRGLRTRRTLYMLTHLGFRDSGPFFPLDPSCTGKAIHSVGEVAMSSCETAYPAIRCFSTLFMFFQWEILRAAPLGQELKLYNNSLSILEENIFFEIVLSFVNKSNYFPEAKKGHA